MGYTARQYKTRFLPESTEAQQKLIHVEILHEDGRDQTMMIIQLMEALIYIFEAWELCVKSLPSQSRHSIPLPRL